MLLKTQKYKRNLVSLVTSACILASATIPSTAQETAEIDENILNNTPENQNKEFLKEKLDKIEVKYKDV